MMDKRKKIANKYNQLTKEQQTEFENEYKFAIHMFQMANRHLEESINKFLTKIQKSCEEENSKNDHSKKEVSNDDHSKKEAKVDENTTSQEVA